MITDVDIERYESSKERTDFRYSVDGWLLAYVLYVLLFASLSLGDEVLVDEVVWLLIGRSS